MNDRFADRQVVAAEEWLGVLRDEYLAEYIQSGGSAVKVVSGTGDVPDRVGRTALNAAAESGYCTAWLDPTALTEAGKRPDFHRIDRFFLGATAGVDWKGWTASQARRFLESRGLRVPDGVGDLDGIAAANGRDMKDLLSEFQAGFATSQLRDAGMSLEFREAVTALARAQMLPDVVSPTTEDVLLEWLAGRSVPGGATSLKKIQIFERINAGNARHMLASFCRWLPRTGHDGLVVVLDFRPYEHKKSTKPQRQAETLRRVREATALGATGDEIGAIMADADDEPAVTYTDTAYLLMLALIRRFIDEIDWFERFLLVILTTPGFYDLESKRSYFDYDALQTRIGLEVHDARRANPSAALVHLGGGK